MSDLQAPIINFQVKGAKSKAGFSPQRALLIVKVDDDASASDAHYISDLEIATAPNILGAKSIALKAFKRFRKYNKATTIDIWALKDKKNSTTAKAAMASLQVTGTSLEDVTLRISMGDDGYISYVPIVTGDTGEKVAEKIIKITNEMMTGVVDSTTKSKINYTMSAKGAWGNGANIRVLAGVSGLLFSSTSMAGGVDDFTVSDGFTKLTHRYQTVVFDKLTPAKTVYDWLDLRFNSPNAVNGGVGFMVDMGTVSNLKTTWGAVNSKCLTVIGNPDEMPLNAVDILLASEFAAKRALRMTDGEVLGDLVIDATEAFGGMEKASLPYHNTPMSYEQPINEISLDDLKKLNAAGVSIVVPATIGMVMGSLRTTYKVNGSGVADATFGFLNAVDTSLAVQEYLFNNCKKEFGQTRATHGDLVQGQSMTNALSVKSYIVSLYQDLADLTLAQGGADAEKAFKNGLTVTLDSTTGFYSVFAPVAIVSQFRGLNGVIAISYNFD